MIQVKHPEIADSSGDKYKYGFVTDIEADMAPIGLNPDIIRLISQKKGEPEWLLEWRLKAFEFWRTMQEPEWAKLSYDKIDYQSLHYYSAPKQKQAPKSLDEVDKDLLETYNKLGIPLKEQEVLAGVVAVDAVFDSVSVATTYRAKLAEKGIIFCSISEAAVVSDGETMSYSYYHKNVKPKPAAPAPEANGPKKYVCQICGYIHEGDMPDDFECPLCKHGKEDFEEVK